MDQAPFARRTPQDVTSASGAWGTTQVGTAAARLTQLPPSGSAAAAEGHGDVATAAKGANKGTPPGIARAGFEAELSEQAPVPDELGEASPVFPLVAAPLSPGTAASGCAAASGVRAPQQAAGSSGARLLLCVNFTPAGGSLGAAPWECECLDPAAEKGEDSDVCADHVYERTLNQLKEGTWSALLVQLPSGTFR